MKLNDEQLVGLAAQRDRAQLELDGPLRELFTMNCDLAAELLAARKVIATARRLVTHEDGVGDLATEQALVEYDEVAS